MNRLRLLLPALAFVLLTTACHTDYRPPASEISRKLPDDEQQVALAREAWIILSNKNRQSEWPAATAQYNKALRVIFQRVRAQNFMTQGHFDFQKERPFVIKQASHPEDRDHGLYEDAVPCDMINSAKSMEERVFVEGIGLPIAGIVRKNQKQTNADQDSSSVLKDRGNIHTLTAILDFGKNPSSKPVLRVLPRLDKETIRIGSSEHPLAADFTAPIALFWNKTALGDTALLGAFRPRKTMNYSGLYFSEPYNPKKIPVLLTHGLLSSPDTFSNLVNRLMVDPEIRENYQFWYFSYPSGISWVKSAQKQRRAIEAVAKEYDPKGTSKTFNNMVMVGHSMGGLITRYNNATRPWGMIPQIVRNQEGLLNMDYDQVSKTTIINPETTEIFRDSFIFKPSKQTSRIVFMATPHRGSSFADTWIGMLGEHLIRLPENILMEAARMITLSSDMLLLNPENIEKEFTSIRQLSPSSSLIRGVQTMTPAKNIPAHSIIGSKRWNPLFRTTDGVVPYWSSHLDWSTSEKIVRSGHSVQDTIEAADELRSILREHLSKLGIKENCQFHPPTIWQTNPTPELTPVGYLQK